MKTFLDEIIASKKLEIAKKKKSLSFGELFKKAHPAIRENSYEGRRFPKRLLSPKVGDVAVIAEIKLRTPTSGILGKKEDAESLALSYQNGYADALSVVVDEKYFGGSLEMFLKIKKAVGIPVLYKDFVIDSYQILEALQVRADAILLIAKIQEYYDQDFYDILAISGITPIIEVSSEDEITSSLLKTERMIGVNARDLRTFEVDIDKACQIIKNIPKDKDTIMIGFSGVNSRYEVEAYMKAGARAVLVGTAAMRAENPSEFIRSLKKI